MSHDDTILMRTTGGLKRVPAIMRIEHEGEQWAIVRRPNRTAEEYTAVHVRTGSRYPQVTKKHPHEVETALKKRLTSDYMFDWAKERDEKWKEFDEIQTQGPPSIPLPRPMNSIENIVFVPGEDGDHDVCRVNRKDGSVDVFHGEDLTLEVIQQLKDVDPFEEKDWVKHEEDGPPVMGCSMDVHTYRYVGTDESS